MHHFKYYTKEDIAKLTRKRHGETKVGDKVSYLPKDGNVEEFLLQSKAKFVLIGIPEDIGVRANYGRSGANTAWAPALENILNLQHNSYLRSEDLIVLGEVEMGDLMEQAKGLGKSLHEIEKLRKLVEFIDARVYDMIELVDASNKIRIGNTYVTSIGGQVGWTIFSDSRVKKNIKENRSKNCVVMNVK